MLGLLTNQGTSLASGDVLAARVADGVPQVQRPGERLLEAHRWKAVPTRGTTAYQGYHLGVPGEGGSLLSIFMKLVRFLGGRIIKKKSIGGWIL